MIPPEGVNYKPGMCSIGIAFDAVPSAVSRVVLPPTYRGGVRIASAEAVAGGKRGPLTFLSFFRATHQGAEINLVRRRGDRLLGMECKRTDTPRVTRSFLSPPSTPGSGWQ